MKIDLLEFAPVAPPPEHMPERCLRVGQRARVMVLLDGDSQPATIRITETLVNGYLAVVIDGPEALEPGARLAVPFFAIASVAD